MEAAALPDLPVHPGATSVVDLKAIEAEVRAPALGMLRVHEGQGDERAAILRPAGERGKAVETNVRGNHVHDRARAPAPRADAQQLARHVARAPELSRCGGQERLRELGQPAHQAQRPRAKGHLGPPARAEEVGHEGHGGAHRAREQERRPVGGDHAPVDLGRFEPRIDGHGDGGEVAFAAKLIEEGPEVGE